MKYMFLIIMGVCVFGCKKNNVQLRFLDEYILKDSMIFKNSMIGGLSGIDNYKDLYYLVVDDAKKPRVLTSKITIEKGKIKDISFKNIIYIKDTSSTFYRKEVLDLESIFIDSNAHINLVSEGSIKNGKRPTVFISDSLGRFVNEVYLPSNLGNINEGKHKHNAVFEGSCKSIDKKGFWVSLEAPLNIDVEKPSYENSKLPVRITYFDSDEGKATKQYIYELSPIERPPRGAINSNGVTAILEFRKEEFFIVERIYQSGYGIHGNMIRIFKATTEKNTTNTLNMNTLRNVNYIPLKKNLLFDFNRVNNQLKKGVIDNVEGICFGDVLPNGNKTLLLISDNNFQLNGKQFNQFLLLEMVE